MRRNAWHSIPCQVMRELSDIALFVQTSSSEGILFYAREQYPVYNHLAVSLHNATVHVSVIFVDQISYRELFVSSGTHLNDDRSVLV